MRKIGIGLILLGLFVVGNALAAVESVGMIKTLEGNAYLLRAGESIPLQVGTQLLVGDVLKTNQGGALGFILKDNTVFTLGSDSELTIDAFLFSPEKQDLGLVVSLMQGTATYLSGLIGKLAPKTVRVETPDATIGIRGTHFAVKVGRPDGTELTSDKRDIARVGLQE